MRPCFDVGARRVAPSTPVLPVDEGIEKAYDPLLSMLALESSVKRERSRYEEIAPVGAKDIDDTEAIRRAIHAINNYYNVLGIYRDDFDRAECDRLARNAYYALCEKATLDYLSTIEYEVTDKHGELVEIANDFLEAPNPQEDFGHILKMIGRDLTRYDQGVVVKSFNKAGYMTEMKAYLGPEFWVETDRVMMDMTGQYGVNFQGFWTHGYVKRWWQRSVMGVYIPFHPEEVCRFMMYPRSDGIYGTDFLKVLKHQIQYLIDSTRAAGKTFENGIVPSLVWEHPDIMTVQQLQQRITETKGDNQGSYRFGDILHLVNNEKVSTISSTLIDMQWLEGQKFVAQLIWSMWGFSASEFIDQDENRATAYVKRNITKSRMLQPILRHIEQKVNAEILPFLKGWKKGWEFKFATDLDLDDELKKAQINAVKSTTYSAYRSQGFKPSLALKLADVGDDLDTDTIETIDDIAEAQDLLALSPAGGLPMFEDVEQSRYGPGSEGYSPMTVSDYGAGGEQTEQRMGEKEEREFSKGMRYISDQSQAPKGVTVHRGSRGGLYYYTSDSPSPGESGDSGDGGDPSKKPNRGWQSGGGEVEPAPSSRQPAPGKDQADRPATVIIIRGDQAEVIIGISPLGVKLLKKSLPGSDELVSKITKCIHNSKTPGDIFLCAKRIANEQGYKLISNL